MKKIFLILGLIYINHTIYSQSVYVDSLPLPKVGFATKIFAGPYFYPSGYAASPGPAAGLSLSLFAGRFEIETGACYFRKFDQTLAPGESSPYQSVFHTQDYLNAFILTNIKIAQVKRNVFTGYLGLSFRKNLNWNTDTLLDDGSHREASNVQTSAQRTVGLTLLAGVRHMYFFSPRICLVTSLDLGDNIYNEFRYPAGDHADSQNLFPPPPEPDFQIGFTVGVQFTLAGRPGKFYKE
jgi:hypothetical protein